MGPGSGEDDVTAKLAQLSASSADERAAAAQYFATLGDDLAATAAAVPLIATLADADQQVREWAAAALESLGPPRASDLAALVAQLSAAHALQIYWAATLLGRLGRVAASARSALEQVATGHADPSVARRAKWALEKVIA